MAHPPQLRPQAAAPSLGTALVWLRRDLRAHDHAALHHALRAARQVHVCFVFDTDILRPLPRVDRRVAFIRAALVEVDAELRALGGPGRGGLIVRHGVAAEEVVALARRLGVQAVYASHDDEPAALARDAQVRGGLAEAGIALHTSKDHVIFERREVLTAGGTPFSVFTPYRRAWQKHLQENATQALADHAVAPLAAHLATWPPAEVAGVPSLADIGFEPVDLAGGHILTGTSGAYELLADFLDRIDAYHETRDFPAVKGPSYLGAHLRFGTLSIRELVRAAHERAQAGSRGAEVWLSELIWREFYAQLLHHHPRVVEHAFKPALDGLAWLRGKAAQARFDAWCEGRTGYPLVDAGMRQLVQTGYMHNRLRMLTASFLAKDLGVDWKRGEAWFAQHLLDFELASNNGGWQWAASTGCDAQPWFRVFNPTLQSRRFDPRGRFIRRYVPELAALDDSAIHAPSSAARAACAYPEPLVDHEAARQATLERYGRVAQAGKRSPTS